MLVSILHRITGGALSTVGLGVLTWWLASLAAGPEAYATFLKVAGHPVGLVVLIGLTWAFFQKTLAGIRHLALDTGAGFEIGINKRFAILTVVGSVLLTVLMWAYLLGVRA